MKRRIRLVLTMVVVLMAVLVPLQGSGAEVLSRPVADQPVQLYAETVPDLSTLLDCCACEAHIEELVGPDRAAALDMLTHREETIALIDAMADKGFEFADPTFAEVMRVEIACPSEPPTVVTAMSWPVQANELSAAITAMVDEQDMGFFQAHHTNLDPNLAEVPDPPIIVNGMPYFYITTLRWINGRIIRWHYWWFDSHHHPNWYYSHYYWYWWYYRWYDVYWPYWYCWTHGWYYWRYWYYWSTWFPWVAPVAPAVPN